MIATRKVLRKDRSIKLIRRFFIYGPVRILCITKVGQSLGARSKKSTQSIEKVRINSAQSSLGNVVLKYEATVTNGVEDIKLVRQARERENRNISAMIRAPSCGGFNAHTQVGGVSCSVFSSLGLHVSISSTVVWMGCSMVQVSIRPRPVEGELKDPIPVSVRMLLKLPSAFCWGCMPETWLGRMVDNAGTGVDCRARAFRPAS
jgi:hypothetical protein